MKLTLSSTDHTVNVGGTLAYVWEGVTEQGERCHALIVSLAFDRDADPRQLELPRPPATTRFPAGFRP
jgi:hypothetical protein